MIGAEPIGGHYSGGSFRKKESTVPPFQGVPMPATVSDEVKTMSAAP